MLCLCSSQMKEKSQRFVETLIVSKICPQNWTAEVLKVLRTVSSYSKNIRGGFYK